MLNGILESLYEKKDNKRAFSKEQRRIIWNSEKDQICTLCDKVVTWEDFTADHVKPHSEGGKTKIINAAITHRSCNSRKGNR
ncbi:MAG: HNH endonuclease [Candidatus Scalindua sp.]